MISYFGIVMAFTCFAAQADDITTTRCPESGVILPRPEAYKVAKWAYKCGKISSSSTVFPILQVYATNPPENYSEIFWPYWFIPGSRDAWKGPLDTEIMTKISNEDCSVEIPPKYSDVWICQSGCFAQGERILFALDRKESVQFGVPFSKNGTWIPIEKSIAKVKNIFTVSEGSTFSNIKYSITGIKSFLTDKSEHFQDILEIVAKSGGKLRITPNHPLLSNDGNVRQASEFKVGDLLVRADGTSDQIVSIEKEKYFGKVYNLDPNSKSLLGKLILAEGYVNGSSYYQNQELSKLNRILLRENLSLGN